METNLKQVLMEREGMTAKEANSYIKELKQRVQDGENPEEILLDELGLEPDYVFELLF